MSYCRWSSDDFACDVYVYESAHGWEIHVAARRVVPVEPMPAPISDDPSRPEWANEYLARHREVSRIIDASERHEIGLPHDGESYTDSTPGECADRLKSLRAIGYNVPQYAIDELRAEATAAAPDREGEK